MKLTAKQIRQIIKEELDAVSQVSPVNPRKKGPAAYTPFHDPGVEDRVEERRKLSRLFVKLINTYGRDGAKDLVDDSFSVAVSGAKMSSF